MTDNAPTEGGALVWIKVVTTELTTSDPADRMNEVGPVEIFESILIRVMRVGAVVEVVGRRVLPTFLVTCILWSNSVHVLGRTPKDLRGNPPR